MNSTLLRRVRADTQKSSEFVEEKVVSDRGIEPTGRPMRFPESDYSSSRHWSTRRYAVSVSASRCRPSAVMAMRSRAQCFSIDAKERPLLHPEISSAGSWLLAVARSDVARLSSGTTVGRLLGQQVRKLGTNLKRAPQHRNTVYPYCGRFRTELSGF
jgi:hypothetical protein